MQRDQQTGPWVKGAAWGRGGHLELGPQGGHQRVLRSPLISPGSYGRPCCTRSPVPSLAEGCLPQPPAPTLRHPQPGVFSVGAWARGVTRRGFSGVVRRQATEVWVSFTACGGGRWAGPAGPGRMPHFSGTAARARLGVLSTFPPGLRKTCRPVPSPWAGVPPSVRECCQGPCQRGAPRAWLSGPGRTADWPVEDSMALANGERTGR